jgi:hypothetical protein
MGARWGRPVYGCLWVGPNPKLDEQISFMCCEYFNQSELKSDKLFERQSINCRQSINAKHGTRFVQSLLIIKGPLVREIGYPICRPWDTLFEGPGILYLKALEYPI